VTPARVHVGGTGFETQDLLDAMLTVLAEGQTDWDPVWNPGGDRIAWTKLLPGLPPQVDLFVADANGDHRLQLTDDTALDGMHSWSPDSSQLVYVSDAGGKFNNTYTVNVADGAVTRLTTHDVNDYAPFWSVDGRQVLVVFSFSKALRDGVLEMHVMNADGSNLHLLGTDEVFTGDLTYAPDGETVAYVSNVSGTWQIYLMNADGTNVRQITHGDSNNLYPAWRPVPANK
jgi:TolB protein